MRILALCHGVYGTRIAQHVADANGTGWTIDVLALPVRLPLVIDDPEEFMPSEVPRADLVLAMGESAESAQLIPAIVGRSGAKAAILPVGNSSWLPPGLKNQIREEIAMMGVTAAFPKTFCTLTETACGFGADTEPYHDTTIAAFASRFGRPKLEIQLDKQGRVEAIEVKRSAPCGSTHLVAKKLMGVFASEAVPQAGLYAHHFPCLASMSLEANGETLMHISGHVVNEQVSLRLSCR